MPGASRSNGRLISTVVADILSVAFRQTGMTQLELGAMVGVSQSQVSKYLRGTRVPDIDVLHAMCAALGLDTAAVVADAERRLGTDNA